MSLTSPAKKKCKGEEEIPSDSNHHEESQNEDKDLAVLAHSEKHLMQFNGTDVTAKLLMADRYNIAPLKEQCLQSFTSAPDLCAKLKCPEFAQLSGDMKVAILDRLAEL